MHAKGNVKGRKVGGNHWSYRRIRKPLKSQGGERQVEELIDARLLHKLDENGYMDNMAARYGLK